MRKVSDAAICQAITAAQALYGWPPDTVYLAQRMGYKTETMRRRLLTLAAAGCVRCGSKRSGGGYTWQVIREI